MESTQFKPYFIKNKNNSGYIGSAVKKTWNRHNSKHILPKKEIIQDVLDQQGGKHGNDTIQKIS